MYPDAAWLSLIRSADIEGVDLAANDEVAVYCGIVMPLLSRRFVLMGEVGEMAVYLGVVWITEEEA